MCLLTKKVGIFHTVHVYLLRNTTVLLATCKPLTLITILTAAHQPSYILGTIMRASLYVSYDYRLQLVGIMITTARPTPVEYFDTSARDVCHTAERVRGSFFAS